MRTIYVLSILVMCGHRLHSQVSTSLKQTLFYKLNEVESPGNEARIDSLLQFAGHDSVTVTIQGYADFLGSTGYNASLSQKRAEAAKNYLLKKTDQGRLQVTSCKGFGESASQDDHSTEGEPYQRRVDLLMVKRLAEKPKAIQAPAAARVVDRAAEKEKPVTTNGAELLEKGQSMVVEGLLFIPGRHAWTPESKAPLASLLKTLKDYPDLRIEIQGHICCIDGSHDALDYDTNEKMLSTNRARAVYDYLVAGGINGRRMTYKGYGHSQPKVEERNSFHEQMNRRVEIKVLEK